MGPQGPPWGGWLRASVVAPGMALGLHRPGDSADGGKGDGLRSASSMAGIGAMVRSPSADKSPWCSQGNALWPLAMERVRCSRRRVGHVRGSGRGAVEKVPASVRWS